MRTFSSLLLATFVAAGLARAQDSVGEYFEDFATSADGTQLFVQVYRPEGIDRDVRTPVVLNNTIYAPTDGTVAQLHVPTAEAALARGWTWVQASPRGFYRSGGCGDYYGSGEQMDAVAFVEWAESQPWSSGKVATYGISYEGGPSLMAIGGGANVAASVIVDGLTSVYDFFYDDGVHYGGNSRLAPPGHAVLQLFPVAGLDTAPVCAIDAQLADLASDDASDPFWQERDLVPLSLGAEVPILWAQGFNDSAVRPDHFTKVWPTLAGPSRAVLPQYVHDLWRRTDRLPEIISFLETHLEGAPESTAPVVRVQDNDGRWRAEQAWPPEDVRPFSFELLPGSFGPGVGSSYAAVDHAETRWTFTRPQSADAHVAGPGSLALEVGFDAVGPVPQAVAGVYDVAPDGTATLVTRGAVLLRSPGNWTMDLHAQDWIVRDGHRLGVALTGSEESIYDRTRAAVPVEILRAQLTLPVLTWQRDRFTDGGVPLGTVTAATTTLPATLLAENGAPVELPAVTRHPCAQPSSRATCPGFLRGSPAHEGVSQTLLDVVSAPMTTGDEYEIVVPEIEHVRDLAAWVTPERPFGIDLALSNVSALSGAPPDDIVRVSGGDLWRNGLIWGRVEPGSYWVTAYSRHGVEQGGGSSVAPQVHFLVVLRGGSGNVTDAQNQPPIAVDDFAFTPAGSAITIDVLANDVDPEDGPLTLTSVGAAAHGAVDCDPDGACTYTPNPGFEGTDEFVYGVCDAHEACDEAVVRVEVGGDVVVQCSTIDDSDRSISYKGGWHRRLDERASNGGYTRRMGSHNTNQGNGSTPIVRVRFEGDGIVYDYLRSARGGAADVFVDGVLAETLEYGANQPGSENPTFGHRRTYAGSGPGAHELTIEHRYGAVYVDGFSVPCEAPGSLASEPGDFTSTTRTSQASALETTLIELPVAIGARDREISVVVEGAALPAIVEVLDPDGLTLATGESLLGGATSGTDAAVDTPGTHSVRVALPAGAVETVEVSVAITTENP